MLGREKHPGGETHQSKEAIKPIPSIWKIKYLSHKEWRDDREILLV